MNDIIKKILILIIFLIIGFFVMRFVQSKILQTSQAPQIDIPTAQNSLPGEEKFIEAWSWELTWLFKDDFAFTPDQIDTSLLTWTWSNTWTLANLCNTFQSNQNNSYKIMNDFFVNNKKEFLTLFIGENEQIPNTFSNKIYYFFDNCDYFDKTKPLYGECLIRMKERDIFMSSNGVKVTNIPELPEIDFEKNEKYVDSGDCEYLKNDKFFANFYTYCWKEDKYKEYIETISRDFLRAVCQK